MVFVKVRETYDLKTTKNKMTVIAIHTPKPDIIKLNYPGLLMQCKSYRPVSCDVRIACASMLPLDPQGVGTSDGDVAPEDIFNPILYSAMSNKGMSQLEARINYLSASSVGRDVDGSSAAVEVDSTTSQSDEFPIYYGLLSDTHHWKHANPQQGLEMSGIKPLVYEMVYNVGDQQNNYLLGSINDSGFMPYAPQGNGETQAIPIRGILGNAREMPMINCTSYSRKEATKVYDPTSMAQTGFPGNDQPWNCEVDVPYIPVVCAGIIVPPSKMHELFYRMVVEWTIEFSAIRPIGEITDWLGLAALGNSTHYQNYSYAKVKEAVTGSVDSLLDNDSCMVSSNVGVNKVM